MKGKGFLNAGELKAGEVVVDSEGGTCVIVIETIYLEIVESPETVYNFQVEDYHTYHVGDIGVLVHNKNYENGRGVVEEVVEGGSNFNGQINRNPELDFVNGKGESALTQHANKHGYSSPEEYLNSARSFLDKQPTSTTQSFVSSEGTYIRYDTETNEFGIINKYGGISTCFKPENGMAYWLEQIE